MPEIYGLLYDQATRLNPVKSSDQAIEMHLQVAKELSGSSDHDGRGVLSLAINHSHCIASYEFDEMTEFETLQKDPHTRKDLHKVLV